MSWDQMTLKIEGVVYGGMSGEEIFALFLDS